MYIVYVYQLCIHDLLEDLLIDMFPEMLEDIIPISVFLAACTGGVEPL